MEPKKIAMQALETVISELIKGSEEARGTYLYKGFRLQISKYKASGAERTSRLYHKRRKLGLCIRCGVKVGKNNSRTGKLYRLCDYHRNLIDRKEGGKSTAKKKTSTSKRKTVKKSKSTTAAKKRTTKRVSAAKKRPAAKKSPVAKKKTTASKKTRSK